MNIKHYPFVTIGRFFPEPGLSLGLLESFHILSALQSPPCPPFAIVVQEYITDLSSLPWIASPFGNQSTQHLNIEP